MKSQIILRGALLLVAAGSVFSFSSVALAADVDTAAADYCKCAEPALSEIKNMQQAMSSGDMAALQRSAAVMSEKSMALQNCFGELQQNYQHLENDEGFKQAVTAEIEKRCPRPTMGMAGMPAGMPVTR